MKTFTEYLKEGEKSWKQTSMSPAKAMKEYGKENVKVKKGGLRNGDDMVEVYVENYQDRYNKVASTANAIKVGKSNATMPQDAVRKVSGDSSYTHADNPFYQKKADDRKNDGLGKNAEIIKRMKPGADGKFVWGRDKLGEETKGCSDCEYMKDETDGEIDTCDECAAEERANARAKTNEAGGYYTKPVYDMIEQHGIEKVMHELLTALDADVIQDALSRMGEGLGEEVTATCEDCGCTIGQPETGCECNNDAHTHAHEELDYLRKLAGI